jgi:hypothetical protein
VTYTQNKMMRVQIEHLARRFIFAASSLYP